jgi:hypothetical protein
MSRQASFFNLSFHEWGNVSRSIDNYLTFFLYSYFIWWGGSILQFRETFQGLFTPSASSGRLAAGSAHQGASSVANRHNDCNYSTVAANGIGTKSLVTNETGVWSPTP